MDNNLSGASRCAQIARMIEVHGKRPSAIIAILQDIQETYRYLPREVFPLLSENLDLSEAQAYSIQV